MAYSFYPGKPSFLAQKYLRTYIPSRSLQPGERYALRRTMEAKVRFYKIVFSFGKCNINSVTSDDRINNIVFYSRNFNQAIALLPCVGKKLAKEQSVK